MGTLKKFWKYLLIFVITFIMLSGLTSLAMKENYKDITNYKIVENSLEITVSESRATNNHGYIKGSVTNSTKEIIPLKYLRISLYDESGVYLGSEYKELKNFYPKETINYDISYNYNNVDKIILDFTDKITENKVYNFFSNIEDKELEIALPVAGFLVLYTILP